jgi:hypothetical protein
MNISFVHLLMIATLAADIASCSVRYEAPASAVTASDSWVQEALNEPLENIPEDLSSCESRDTSTLE